MQIRSKNVITTGQIHGASRPNSGKYAINTEMTLMLGEPHHLVSTSKLGRLFATFGISESDLASFHETELALDEPDTNVIPFIPKKSE